MTHCTEEQIARKILQIVENSVEQQRQHARETEIAVSRVVTLKIERIGKKSRN